MKFLKSSFTWFEVTAIIVSGYYLFFPKPYDVAFILVVFTPIIGLFLNFLNGRKSILTLFRLNKDYSLTVFFKFPAIAILIRVILEFNLEDNFSLISPSITTFCLIMILIGITHKIEVPSDINYLSIYIPLVFFVALYSTAVTFGMNCVFDTSRPSVYNSKVTDKRIYSNKGKSYNVVLESWKDGMEDQKISISSEEYNSIEIGKHTDVIVYEGFLNIPWFYADFKASH